MKKILFITTQYRVGERIYPIIPQLTKEFEVHLLVLYQMHPSHNWPGNIDVRTSNFMEKYVHLFKNVLTTIYDIKFEQYDLILCDDNRATKKWESEWIYQRKKCPMVCCSHGNTDDDSTKNHNKVFDKCFVFGKKEKTQHTLLGGIPSNDILLKQEYMSLTKEHILVIVNFLGNRYCEFKVAFDKHFFNNCGLVELQEKYNKKILIKLKSRADERGINNEKYISNIMPENLDYKIIIDTKDDNKLIAQSQAIISAPSTIAFKAIQYGVPTVLIKNSGQTGLFYDYPWLIDLDKDKIINAIEEQSKLITKGAIIIANSMNKLNRQKNKEWIDNTIEGGSSFNSTEIFINEIKKLI